MRWPRTIRSEYVLAVKGCSCCAMRRPSTPRCPPAPSSCASRNSRSLAKPRPRPFAIDDDTNVGEALRLKYRYLDLRRPEMQQKLLTRHRIVKLARDYYDENGFLEIETPTLGKSTPEGARDYLVPSRVHPGKFYALPQSPQLYKQILMVSGFDRYFQVARCYRDEDLRADRQPEFTQLDIEMSFVDEDDVITVNEGFIQRVFKEVVGVDVQLPLPRMKWQEAMDRFGSDKPDTRFGLELIDVSDIAKETSFKVFSGAVEAGGSVRAINCKDSVDKLARREIDARAISESVPRQGPGLDQPHQGR